MQMTCCTQPRLVRWVEIFRWGLDMVSVTLQVARSLCMSKLLLEPVDTLPSDEIVGEVARS